MKRTVLECTFFLLFIIGFVNFTFALKPDREYILTPDSVEWSYEELQILTEDNFEVNTWVYAPNPETNNNTVLILAYSDAGNMSYSVYHAAALANAGYAVVTFDYRGFGKSSDFEMNSNYLYYNEFCNDLKAVVDRVNSDFEDSEIGIWALSMGTTITARSFSTIKDKIDFIIGEGFVTDTANLVARIKSQKDRDIILPEPSSLFTESIVAIDCPLLIFSGSFDTVTTTKDAVGLKEKVGTRCKIVEYAGGHLGGFQAWPDKGFGNGYIEQINAFLEGS